MSVAKIVLPSGKLTELEIPEVTSNPRWRDPDLFTAGEWSFDVREEDDPQLALEAIGAWIAWYLFLTKDKS